MDNVLKQEMDNLKVQVGDMGDKVDLVSQDVSEIKTALLGNTLTKDGGLIGRIIQLETDNRILEKRIEVLENEKGKSDIYVKILWGAGGAIGISIIGFVLSLLIKH